MNKLMRWLCMVWMTALLVACGGGDGGGDSGAGPIPKAKSTMLVYLLASDLLDGRGAERDLLNMLQASSSKDVNVVLQIGGGKTTGQFPGVDMQKTKRYRLTPTGAPASGGSLTQGWNLELLPEAQQSAQVAMNKTQTLRDFIQWGAQQYPAEQYSLVLWDHGGGPIDGFGWDYSYGERKNGHAVSMSVADITSAIRQAGVHFELIGFDACLMSSLEVAAALQPYANYLVASEEVTTGWDWTAVVQYLVEQPLAKGSALGQAIVQSYKAFGGRDLDFTAYAVTDLKKVPALVKTLEQAAQSLQQALRSGGISTWVKIAAARSNAESFQSNIFSTGYDLVDVLSFVDELSERNLLAPALVQQIREAYKSAVVYQDGGEDEAFGLMMYFPEYSTLDARLLQRYAALEFSPIIKDWVQSYAAFASSSQVPQVTVAAPALNGTALTAGFSSNMPGIAQSISRGYAVLVQNGQAQSMQQISVSGNQLNMAQAQLWPHLDGQLVSMLPDNEENTLFLIPVAIPYDDGSLSYGMLYAATDKQGRKIVKYVVNSGALAGTGVSMLAVRPGREFFPLLLDVATNQLKMSNESIEAPEGDWVVEMNAVQDGGTLYAAATDLVGRLKVSSTGVPLPAAK